MYVQNNEKAIVGKNGRIVIPKKIRRALDINDGSILAISVKENVLLLTKIAD